MNDETQLLLNVLVDQGVITPDEHEELTSQVEEIAAEAAAEAEAEVERLRAEQEAIAEAERERERAIDAHFEKKRKDWEKAEAKKIEKQKRDEEARRKESNVQGISWDDPVNDGDPQT